MIKQISALLAATCFLLGGCAPASSAPKNMYIRPAELTQEENDLAELLGADQRLFDFELDDSVQSMQIACYRLEDGEWKPEVGGWRQFTDPNGRLALGFEDLREGLRTAVQSEHSSGGERYDRPAADDEQAGIATMTLASETSLEYEQEIPLVLQTQSTADEHISFSTDYFFRPEELEQQGYEAVFAVTVCFSEKTVSEQSDVN
ncbi:MAG TPA: hypothetical protein H9985_01045 [Candidatus Anaerofilum faecale]|nr:hypothetical protein [Candidatus Anaerofilum faecale]